MDIILPVVKVFLMKKIVHVLWTDISASVIKVKVGSSYFMSYIKLSKCSQRKNLYV